MNELLDLFSMVTGVPVFILPVIGVFAAGFWAGICITIKRLHDLECPSWHWWLLFQEGTDGANAFGVDPLAGGAFATAVTSRSGGPSGYGMSDS
jgi:uncharacterized membrane protein YhaH (DUF805 family)